MTIATELLQRHLQWLVDDNQHWQELIDDDIVWDLPYATSLGHPLQLDGRESVLRHVSWFVGAVKNFRFSVRWSPPPTTPNMPSRACGPKG